MEETEMMRELKDKSIDEIVKAFMPTLNCCKFMEILLSHEGYYKNLDEHFDKETMDALKATIQIPYLVRGLVNKDYTTVEFIQKLEEHSKSEDGPFFDADSMGKIVALHLKDGAYITLNTYWASRKVNLSKLLDIIIQASEQGLDDLADLDKMSVMAILESEDRACAPN